MNHTTEIHAQGAPDLQGFRDLEQFLEADTLSLLNDYYSFAADPTMVSRSVDICNYQLSHAHHNI